MEKETKWKAVDNEEEGGVLNASNYREINQAAKNLYKACESKGVPVFMAYYLPEKGYQYKGLFPEEIRTGEVQSQYRKFNRFLQVCIDFNKEEYMPTIKTNEV